MLLYICALPVLDQRRGGKVDYGKIDRGKEIYNLQYQYVRQMYKALGGAP
jgi:hypothetical protein